MANLFNTAAQKVSDFANLDKVQALESKYGAGSTGLPSDARHMAAMNQLSNAIATPINKISEPLGTFVGDTGAFAAGLINEIPGVYRSIKGDAPIKDVWEDIAANWKGSFGTPNITTSEEIYKDVYGIPSIDPTGRNLFTQYYEDDPYAGIEGQTAFFNPLSLLTFGSKMLGPAHAYKTGGINELMKYKIRKEISKDVAKKGKKAAQKILEAKAAAKAKAEAEARKKQQQKTIAAKGTAQGSGGTFVHSSGAMKGYEKGAGGGKDAPSEHFYIARGGLAQRAPRYANGGLINFYRYGGFI